VEVQVAVKGVPVPPLKSFQEWTEAVLNDRNEAQLGIRIVGREESAELNARYRSKSGPTNVLSFAADLPEEIPVHFLGDLVICAPLVAEEAAEQGKDVLAHWAHLVVHGILHLIGFDHVSTAQASEMESQEIAVLGSLGIPDPYAER